MRFTFEIEDEWMEEEYLSEALTAELKRSVTHQILQKLDARIQSEITAKVEETISAMIEPRIAGTLTELVNTGKIVKNNAEVSITDHLKALFQNSTGWNNPGEQIARLAKGFGDELKKRYDVAFANQIVVRISENGMLKDDVVNLLLTKS